LANLFVINQIPDLPFIHASPPPSSIGDSLPAQPPISATCAYTTAHGSLTVTAVTPVKLGGISTRYQPLQYLGLPVQRFNDQSLYVKFDPVSISLTPSSDYYLTVFYTNDANQFGDRGRSARTLSRKHQREFSWEPDATRLPLVNLCPPHHKQHALLQMYVMNN